MRVLVPNGLWASDRGPKLWGNKVWPENAAVRSAVLVNLDGGLSWPLLIAG